MHFFCICRSSPDSPCQSFPPSQTPPKPPVVPQSTSSTTTTNGSCDYDDIEAMLANLSDALDAMLEKGLFNFYNNNIIIMMFF